MQNLAPCFVVGMLSLLLSNLAGAQDYVWTEIVIPGATVFRAAGLNDKGETAVITTDGRTGIYRDGTFAPLPPPPKGLQVEAWGVNNDGVITGCAFTVPDTCPQGFILRGSTYTFFSRQGWENTTARAIADSGLITGQSFNADGRNAGFILEWLSSCCRPVYLKCAPASTLAAPPLTAWSTLGSMFLEVKMFVFHLRTYVHVASLGGLVSGFSGSV